MNQQQKIDAIKELSLPAWQRERAKVDDEISSKQGFKCICGRLATGLHESTCSRFKKKVDVETFKRLKYLLTTQKDIIK